MQELAHKRKVRGILYSPITAIILLALIITGGKATWNLYQKSKEARAGKDQIAKEINEVAEREAFLKVEIEDFNTEKGVEGKIRSKFNVKKEGEEVAIITKAFEESEPSGTPEKTWFNSFIVRIVDFFQ